MSYIISHLLDLDGGYIVVMSYIKISALFVRTVCPRRLVHLYKYCTMKRLLGHGVCYRKSNIFDQDYILAEATYVSVY